MQPSLLLSGISFSVLLVSCMATKNNSKLDFATFDQSGQYLENRYNFLINKVHTGIKFDISILKPGSEVNLYTVWDRGLPSDISRGDCIDAPTAALMVKQSLRLWLATLKKKHLEGLKYSSASNGAELAIPEPTFSPGSVEVNVKFNFICARGRSLTDPRKSPLVVYYEQNINHQFDADRLTHEIGHAFGLADLYDFQEKDLTRGNQPLRSIMASDEIKEPTPDDADGLEWLYRLHVLKEFQDSTHCAAGYIFDVKSKGCVIKDGVVEQKKSFCHHAGGTMSDKGCLCPSSSIAFDPYMTTYLCNDLPVEKNVSTWGIVCPLFANGAPTNIVGTWLYPGSSTFQFSVEFQNDRSPKIKIPKTVFTGLTSDPGNPQLVLDVLNGLIEDNSVDATSMWKPKGKCYFK